MSSSLEKSRACNLCLRVSAENTEFTGNFLDGKKMKAESLFLTYLWFKAFLLGECKMPSSEILFENTLDFHRKLKGALGDIRAIHFAMQ